MLRRFWIVPLLAIVAVMAAAWLARARLAEELAENYFRQHGIASNVTFGRLGLAGLSGRVTLGPADAPDFYADAVEVKFDPISLMPRIVEVELVNPVVRARMDAEGKVSLPSLQTWIDSLATGDGHSQYVSDDLVISASHLRALLATPGGAVELDGDARLKHGQLVSASLSARPGVLTYQGVIVRIGKASLNFDTVPDGYRAAASFEGGLKASMLEATQIVAQLDAPNLLLDLNSKSFAAPALTIKLRAGTLSGGGLKAGNPAIALTANDVRVSLAGDSSAKLHIAGGADFTPGPLTDQLPVLARDKGLVAALRGNLRHLDISLEADVARKNGELSLSLLKPLDIGGAQRGRLRLTAFALQGTTESGHGSAEVALAGPRLPALSLRSRDFQWRDGGLTGDAALRAHFDFAMLHGADLAANGTAAFKDGVFAFNLAQCAPASLAAFHPGASDLARDIKGTICGAAGEKTVSADVRGWKFAGLAHGLEMTLPLGNVQLAGGTGRVAFSGKGAAMGGKISVMAATMTDRAKPRRFEPLAGSGDITLDDWVWHGAFAVVDGGGTTLGKASFNHVMASGTGEMQIAASLLHFEPDRLQPVKLSPLLAPLSHAVGTAHFDGVVGWTPSAIQSNGTLTIDSLDFLTPLGTAHAVKAAIKLNSLLPPVTAPGQHIAISRIDWTLPVSSIALDFSFGGSTLQVDGLSGSIAEGGVKLGAFTVDLSGPAQVNGVANIDGISLAPLVAASNLDSKIKLEGKVTGTVPFAVGPEGFRIVNGHLQSVGPGRISLNRAVWSQNGEPAANAVQDLAYQALENLAFDQMTADINSVAGGRLQIVFHVKGHSDPPKPQQAEVALVDIINGSALQKPIALPSATPIDLTLDTSLNFDELLKSYAEAWSKTLSTAP